MGTAERVGRRKVLTAANEAVDKANDLVGRYNECVRALNETRDRVDALDTALKSADAALTGRLDVHGQWAVRIDDRLTPLEHEAVYRNARLVILEEFYGVGFLGRLRWLLLGC